MAASLDPNPFAKPIISTIGDADEAVIFQSVGYALSKWELCEAMFGILYSCFIKPTGNPNLALRAYGTLLAAGARREMISEAALAYVSVFPDDILASRLRGILNLYQDGSARRNDMAHGFAMSGTTPIDLGKSLEFFLVPGFFASKKRPYPDLTPKYKMNSTDITRLAECFKLLSSEIGSLVGDVRHAYASLPETLRKQHL